MAADIKTDGANNKPLIIDAVFSDGMHDTKVCSVLFEHIRGEMLYNPTKDEILRLLKSYDPTSDGERGILFFGHGGPNGLFSPDWRSYLFDREMSAYVKKRNVVGIWCDADAFARRCKLTGFFTSMYISNVKEAVLFNMAERDESVIVGGLETFLLRVGQLIDKGVPTKEWSKRLKEMELDAEDFTRYNYDGLVSLNEGEEIV